MLFSCIAFALFAHAAFFASMLLPAFGHWSTRFVGVTPIPIHAQSHSDGTVEVLDNGLPETPARSMLPHCTIANNTGVFSGTTSKIGGKALDIPGFEDLVTVSATEAIGCTMNAMNMWGHKTEDVSALPQGECVTVTYDEKENTVAIDVLPIVGLPKNIAFHPHGSFYDASAVPPRILFVNHGYSKGGERLDAFTLTKDNENAGKKVLKYLGPIVAGDAFTKEFNGVINDVVTTPSGDAVLVTKYMSDADPIRGRFTEGHMSELQKRKPIMEAIYRRASGVYRCPILKTAEASGAGCVLVTPKTIGMANGIARGRVLGVDVAVVMDSTANSVHVFEIRDDGRELVPIATKSTPEQPLSMPETAGDVLVQAKQALRKIRRMARPLTQAFLPPFAGEKIIPHTGDNVAPLDPTTPVAQAEGPKKDTLRFSMASIGHLWNASKTSEHPHEYEAFGGATELILKFSTYKEEDHDVDILPPFKALQEAGVLPVAGPAVPSAVQLETVFAKDRAMVDRTTDFHGLGSAIVFGNGRTVAMGAYYAYGIAVCSVAEKWAL